MQEEQMVYDDQYDFEEEIDLDALEMPQLVRRNGIIHQDQDAVDFKILEKPTDKIYFSEQCPICLEENQDLQPLKCGHMFCLNDIQKLVENSKTSHHLIQCPICRAFQILDNINAVPTQNDVLMQFVQSIC